MARELAFSTSLTSLTITPPLVKHLGAILKNVGSNLTYLSVSSQIGRSVAISFDIILARCPRLLKLTVSSARQSLLPEL